MSFRLAPTIISAIMQVLILLSVSHGAVALSPDKSDKKKLPEAIVDPAQMIGVFYTDDYYPDKTSTINGVFWLYDFSTGRQERIFTFPMEIAGISHKFQNNQILFNNGGDLSLLRLPTAMLTRISEKVTEYAFSQNGLSVYYVTCKEVCKPDLTWEKNMCDLYQHSITTGVTKKLKADIKVDVLLGTDATNERILFAVRDEVYAIRTGRVKRIYKAGRGKES
ncbi:MAG: hypothetical protein HZB33_02970 [Nitrospirae bacterium]|nr:hypothetical protein [Nitrospirota bacterium]